MTALSLLFIPCNSDKLFLAAFSIATIVAFFAFTTLRCLDQFDSSGCRGVIVQVVNPLGREGVVPRLDVPGVPRAGRRLGLMHRANHH